MASKKDDEIRLNTYEETFEVKTMEGLRNILKVNQAYFIVKMTEKYIVFTGSKYTQRQYAINKDNRELVQELLNPVLYIKKESD